MRKVKALERLIKDVEQAQEKIGQIYYVLNEVKESIIRDEDKAYIYEGILYLMVTAALKDDVFINIYKQELKKSAQKPFKCELERINCAYETATEYHGYYKKYCRKKAD